MVAAAAKQKIKIEYVTVYKSLKIQEQDFKKINSQKPTDVSKASASSAVKNGRIYNGVKWYPTTITNYNPLPGFNIFGTGLCIRIKNNNDKIINFIKTNGADYGWSWCSNFPTTDPDFQNILVYSAGKNKPNKYRDRTSEYSDLGFRPDQTDASVLGYDPATHKSVWMPAKRSGASPGGGGGLYTPRETDNFFRQSINNGKYEVVELPKPTSKETTTKQIYVDSKNSDSPSNGVTFASSGLFGSTTNNKSIKVLTVNNTGRTGIAGSVSNILKNIGFTSTRAIACVMSNYSQANGSIRDAEIDRSFWGSATVKRILEAVPDNYLSQAKSIDAVNYAEFLDIFKLPLEVVLQNPFTNFESLGTFVENAAERITSVFITKDIFPKINDNFLDIIKYIEKNSSLTTLPNGISLLNKSDIVIKKIEVSQSSHPKLYDYMINGKSVVFDINFATYCLLRGWYKLINNNKLTKEIYGAIEIDPLQAQIQYGRYGPKVRDPAFVNQLFNFLEFTSIKPWPKNYPTLDGSSTSNWALAERKPVAGDHFYNSLTAAQKKEYLSLSKIFVPIKLKYQFIEPADIIVNLDSNWGGVTTNQDILYRVKSNQTVVKTIQSSKTVVPTPSGQTRPALPPIPTTPSTAPSTTTTLPKTTTTTTTVPKSTTTSLPPKSNNKKPPAKYIPPADRIDRPISTPPIVTTPIATTISNKTPIIIGDSIALGIAQRYDNRNPLADTQGLGQPSKIENIPESNKRLITTRPENGMDLIRL